MNVGARWHPSKACYSLFNFSAHNISLMYTKILLGLVIWPPAVMLGLENTRIIIQNMKSADDWQPPWIWCSHSSDYEENYLVGDNIICTLLALPWTWTQYVPPKSAPSTRLHAVTSQKNVLFSWESTLCDKKLLDLLAYFHETQYEYHTSGCQVQSIYCHQHGDCAKLWPIKNIHVINSTSSPCA